MVYYTLYLT